MNQHSNCDMNDFDQLNYKLCRLYHGTKTVITVDFAKEIVGFDAASAELISHAQSDETRRRLSICASLWKSDLLEPFDAEAAFQTLAFAWKSQEKPAPEILYVAAALIPYFEKSGDICDLTKVFECSCQYVVPSDYGLLLSVLEKVIRLNPEYNEELPHTVLDAAIQWFGFDNSLILDRSYCLSDRAILTHSLFCHCKTVRDVVIGRTSFTTPLDVFCHLW